MIIVAMTMAEVRAQMEKAPERTPILVRVDGDEFVATYGDQEFRAGNPFGLDSKLTESGVPAPRDLYLVDAEEGAIA